MFDSLVKEVGEKFGLGDKASGLLISLLGLIASPSGDGLSGFIDKFRRAGLGDLVDSWITNGDNKPISNEQLKSALGEETINAISRETGIDKEKATSAMALMVPRTIDTLTPNGEIPDEKILLDKINGFLNAVGGKVLGMTGAAGAVVSGGAEKIGDTAGSAIEAGKEIVGGAAEATVEAGKKAVSAVGEAAGTVGDKVSGAMGSVGDALNGESSGGILSWLLPLLLLGLLIALGFWFCGRGSQPTAPTNTNAQANKGNTNATAPAQTVESSFSITAKDGKYTVTGVVPDQKTFDDIKARLDAQFGAGNVDYSGLKVDKNAKPFEAGWWDNFQKLLPNLKDWKNGALSFAGNAITEAVGLPAAALNQLKSLFSGWKLPSFGGDTAETERKLTEVVLPNGTKLQAYPGGIEDQLVKFIQSDEYKNATNEQLKNKWFDFDDLRFKFGEAELVPESKRQLDNIVAILKAFPDVKIKIGGYTDKKGDDAKNKELSDKRAKAVKALLEKAGVGPQVPEAEGYGEEFAKVPETASDNEREADRKTSIRLIK